MKKKKVKNKKKTKISPKSQKKKQSIPVKIIEATPFAKSTLFRHDSRKIKENFEMTKEKLAAAQTKEKTLFTKPRHLGFSFLFKGKINNLKIKIINLPESQRIKLLWGLVGFSCLIIFIGWLVNFKNILNKQDESSQNNFSFLKNKLENSYQKFQTSFAETNQKNSFSKLEEMEQELKTGSETEKISEISQQIMEKINQENNNYEK